MLQHILLCGGDVFLSFSCSNRNMPIESWGEFIEAGVYKHEKYFKEAIHHLKASLGWYSLDDFMPQMGLTDLKHCVMRNIHLFLIKKQ